MTKRLPWVCLICMLVTVALVGILTESRFQPASVDDLVSSTEDSSAEAAQEESLPSVLQLAKEILVSMQNNVRDYSATMVKRERIGGTLGVESRMQMKVRNPSTGGESESGIAAYLKFESPRLSAGREVIWVEGENDNQLICHEGGFKNWKRLQLDPDGTLAMLGNKYPITEIGLLRLVEKLIEKGERDLSLDSAAVRVVPGQRVGDRECRMIEVRHDEQHPELDFHIAQIFIDDERKIPLRYAAYLWPENDSQDPPLEEEYTYIDVKLNIGLTDKDFDPDNPDYEFP